MSRSGGRILALVLAFSPVASAAPVGRAERCVAAAERGQQERDRAAFTEARASFRACAADECPSLVRKDCAEWLAAVEANAPTVVLGAKDAHGNDVIGARILVDGKPYQEQAESGRAVPLDPGPHVFRFEHPPDAPVELKEVVRMGEHNRPIYGTFAPAASVAPAAPPPAPPPPATHLVQVKHVSGWAYAFGAVAVAGGASFAAFGVLGLSQKNQLRAQCGSSCTDAQVEPLKVKYIVADASLGVGVVAAVISAVLFLTPSAKETTEPGAAVSIAPGPGGGMVSVVGRF